VPSTRRVELDGLEGGDDALEALLETTVNVGEMLVRRVSAAMRTALDSTTRPVSYIRYVSDIAPANMSPTKLRASVRCIDDTD
jgi:hypothetical protein